VSARNILWFLDLASYEAILPPRMSLKKLRGRTIGEFRERAGQAVSSWLERAGWRDSGEYAESVLSRRLNRSYSDAINPVVQGPFFAFADDRERTLASLRSADPAFESKLRNRADSIIAGRFDLLGYRGISIPDSIDWSRDPLAGVTAPQKHWSRIPFLDPAAVGDHKLVWELNRHQFLVVLAQAWWCTGNERYAEACDRLLRSWMDASPPKRGVNWASSLEISYRSIAWLWTLALLGDELPETTRRRALGFLMLSGRHLIRYLSTYFSPNTHLTGEALGLFYLGTALPQCRDSRGWRERGQQILLDCVDRHIRPDGVYVEPATWYHRYTVDIYTQFLLLAQRGGHGIGQRPAAALERSLEYLAFISRPDGTIPIVGDDDGGKLLELDERSSVDARTPLGVGAVLFNRTDFACVAGPASAEMVWLTGPSGFDRFRAIPPVPPARTSRAFPDGGVYVLRDGWHEKASTVVVDAGPHGFLNGGHSHADALSLDLTVRGEPIFVDPGTYTYTSEPDLRDHFRSTAAHNAATIDGLGSAEPSGPFAWSTRAQGRSRLWCPASSAVLFVGSHDGFERLSPPVSYERAIVFLPPDLWVVIDTMSGARERELRVHWQCAPGVTVETDPDASLLLSMNSARKLRMVTAEAEPISITQGWVSRKYGAREAAPHLSCTARGSRASSLATILCATPDAPLEVNPMRDLHGRALGVSWGDRRGLLTRGTCSVVDVETDAAMAWIELDSSEQPTHVTAAGLSRLSIGGEQVPLPAGSAGIFCSRGPGGWECDSVNNSFAVAGQ
jgi:hypothetical protein